MWRNTEDEILKAAISKYGKNVSWDLSKFHLAALADVKRFVCDSNGLESPLCSSERPRNSARRGLYNGMLTSEPQLTKRLFMQVVRMAGSFYQEG